MRKLSIIIIAFVLCLSGCATRFDGTTAEGRPTPAEPTPSASAAPTPTPDRTNVAPPVDEPVAATPGESEAGGTDNPDMTLADAIEKANGSGEGGTLQSEAPATDAPQSIPPVKETPYTDLEVGITIAGLEGEKLATGVFTVTVPEGWEPAENYTYDEDVTAVDKVNRFARGREKLMVAALNPPTMPLDLDNELYVKQFVSTYTNYEWMEYQSYEIIETPIGRGLFWRVNLDESTPYNEGAYVSLSGLIPLEGGQMLNLGMSVPDDTDDAGKKLAWQLLGQFIATAEVSE